MMFWTTRRCLSRSFPSIFRRMVLLGHGRVEVPNEAIWRRALHRDYLTAAGPGSHLFVSRLSPCKSMLFPSQFLRLFCCDEAPKKGRYENFYPSGKRRTPESEGTGKKSEFEEESNNSGKEDSQDNFQRQLQMLIVPLLWLAMIFLPFVKGPDEPVTEIQRRSTRRPCVDFRPTPISLSDAANTAFLRSTRLFSSPRRHSTGLRRSCRVTSVQPYDIQAEARSVGAIVYAPEMLATGHDSPSLK